jgi:predicted nucleic acid-binding protein
VTGGADPQVALADTNVFVALLAGPSHALHEDALALFRRVAEGALILDITPIVVAELVYAFLATPGWDRATVAAQLSSLLSADGLRVREGDVIDRALELFGTRPRLDFPDAYLAATAVLAGPAAIASFDRDYDAIEGLQRVVG